MTFIEVLLNIYSYQILIWCIILMFISVYDILMLIFKYPNRYIEIDKFLEKILYINYKHNNKFLDILHDSLVFLCMYPFIIAAVLLIISISILIILFRFTLYPIYWIISKIDNRNDIEDVMVFTFSWIFELCKLSNE